MNKVIIIAFSLLFMSCQQNVDPNLKVYGIEDFFDNVSISGGYFSTDEEKIIFSSNQSGIFNVYEANIQTRKINKIESCIGYHSFSHVCVFFHYLPWYVDLSIRRGVKPLPITNY